MRTALKRLRLARSAEERAIDRSAREVARGRRTLRHHEQFVEDVLAGRVVLGPSCNLRLWVVAGLTAIGVAATAAALSSGNSSPREPRDKVRSAVSGEPLASAQPSPPAKLPEASGVTPSDDSGVTPPDEPTPEHNTPKCAPRICPTGSNVFLYVKDWRMSAKGGMTVRPHSAQEVRVRTTAGVPTNIRLRSLDARPYTVRVVGAYSRDGRAHNGRWTMHVGAQRRTDRIRILVGIYPAATFIFLDGVEGPHVRVEGHAGLMIPVPPD